MSRIIDIEYSAAQLISSCNEEISNIRSDMNKVERKLKELEQKSGIGKLFHLGEIKRKKDELKRDFEKLKNRLAITEQERAYYIRWGTKIPDGESGEAIRKLMESRKEKLDILTMIECGLM